MSKANLVRLLPCCLSTTAMSGAGPACSVSEALTVIMPYQVSTPPPVLPVSNIPATSTPVGPQFLAHHLQSQAQEMGLLPWLNT